MTKRSNNGFTLVELLTVIAIIAVMAAIIFPVMAGAKRKARESNCMTNLYQIYTAVKQFEQDNHRYPDFIVPPVQFEYSDGTRVWYPDTDTTPVPLEKATGMIDNRLVSLYPEYIRSYRGLICPDSNLHGKGTNHDGSAETWTSTYTTSDYVDDPMFGYWESAVGGGGESQSRRAAGVTDGGGDPVPFKLYAYSSYDSQVPEQFSYREAHFSPVWMYVSRDTEFITNYVSSDGTPGYAGFLEDNPDYDRQLWWRNPPDTTVITWCSYHRDEKDDGTPEKSSRDFVLYLDGHAKRIASVGLVDWTTGWKTNP